MLSKSNLTPIPKADCNIAPFLKGFQKYKLTLVRGGRCLILHSDSTTVMNSAQLRNNIQKQ